MATGLFNLKQVNQAISQGAWSGYIAPKWVEYLVVAGGGGGGQNSGGAGGGGGLLSGIVTVAAGTSYTVTVGSGGAGGNGGSGNGVIGGNSLFGAISATGGGYGGYNALAGGSGGSGGGGGAPSAGSPGVTSAGGSGTSGQGNAGGLGLGGGSGGQAGGGGGAGTVGLNAPVANIAGNGGAGIASSISGSVVTYAGGGGGGTYPNTSTPGTGGVGGGGAGASIASAAGSNGGGNTGGGGGGGAGGSGIGGSGGSGIVVVRYPGNVQFYTGGAITYANGYIVHTFVASGTLAPTTPAVVASDYQISRSLRFNSADSAYLNRTPASASNRTTWTWSAWVKRGSLGTTQILFVGGQDSSNYTNIYFSGSVTDNLELYTYTSGATAGYYYTASVFRDPSAWYHIVYSVDTTDATAANRVKIYVNSVLQTATVSTAFTQNANTWVNSANPHYLGRNQPSSQYFDGYMTEVNFIDGQALTPSSFGATNANTGVWGPKAYTGTYGTNGFYLNFSDNSNTTAATLGKDSSGNGNNWTPNNFSVTAGAGNDSLVDTPTSYGTDYGVGGAVRGNYATLNPLNTAYTGKTLLNGNLDVTGSTLNQVGGHSTIQIPTTGQWYAECTMTATGGGSPFIGVNNGTTTLGANGASYRSDGTKEINGTGSAYGATWTTNDVIGIAVDTSAGSITFYKNGTSQGVAFTTLNSTFTTGLYFSCQGATGTASFTYNFGQRAWAYTPPGGYKALCTQNLPAPTVGSSPTTLANKYFNPVLYTGTGSSQSITGVGFQPDLVWTKSRSGAKDNNLTDAVRGTSKALFSNTTSAEVSGSWVTAFNSDGFTVGTEADANQSGQSFVGWSWKANGSGSTNTSGSITTTVSANTTSGFSIALGTTPSSGSATYGHGLGVAPSFIFAKSTAATSDWFAYHTSLGFNQDIRLNTSSAVSSTTFTYNSANSSTVTIGGSSVAAYWGGNAPWIWYNFAEVAGYSKISAYTGNGSSTGPFVYCGFRPAWVLIKNTTSSGPQWWILDNKRNVYNPEDLALPTSLALADQTIPTCLNFLSNGFQVTTTNGDFNTSGSNYIFMAIAENPFKYSLAR